MKYFLPCGGQDVPQLSEIPAPKCEFMGHASLIDEVTARILKSQFALEKAQSWPRSGTDTEYPAFPSLRCLTKAVGNFPGVGRWEQVSVSVPPLNGVVLQVNFTSTGLSFHLFKMYITMRFFCKIALKS